MNIAQVIFYVLLIDSMGAVLLSWGGVGKKWYNKNFSLFSRYFPMSKGWSAYYLLLVIWIGYLTF